VSPKLVTEKEFIQKANAVHGHRYGYDKVEYMNAQAKIIITCPEHGDFEQNPNHHLRGSGCAECRGVKRLTTQTFIERATDLHGDRYSYDKVEYVNAQTKVTITCPVHGAFIQKAGHHLRRSGCPACAGRKVASDRNLLVLHPEIAAEWHPEKNGKSRPEHFTRGSGKKVWWQCQRGHNWVTTINSRTNKNTLASCPLCRGVQSFTAETFIERAKVVHGDTYRYDKVEYQNIGAKVIITCPEHGDFLQLPRWHMRGKGCPACSGSKKLTTEEFIEQAKAVHGNRYSYYKAEYVTAQTHTIIICRDHGEFQLKPNRHLNGQGCSICQSLDISKRVPRSDQ